MHDNFSAALDLVLRHEGGYADHPDDPGGATNQGVTQAVYDGYRAERRQVPRAVRLITAVEVRAIYRQQYWDRAGCDAFPAGVDYALFDYAVNSGVARAVKDLQRVVGAKVDGIAGLATLRAVEAMRPSDVVNALCDRRMAFLRRLKHWKVFGRGWTKRVTEVRQVAVDMARGKALPAPATFTANPDAARAREADVRESEWIKRVAADPVAALPVVGGFLTTLSDLPPVIQYALAAVIVGGAIWLGVRALRREVA